MAAEAAGGTRAARGPGATRASSSRAARTRPRTAGAAGSSRAQPMPIHRCTFGLRPYDPTTNASDPVERIAITSRACG